MALYPGCHGLGTHARCGHHILDAHCHRGAAQYHLHRCIVQRVAHGLLVLGTRWFYCIGGIYLCGVDRAIGHFAMVGHIGCRRHVGHRGLGPGRHDHALARHLLFVGHFCFW